MACDTTVLQGSDFTIEVRIFDRSNNAIDISSASGRVMVKTRTADSDDDALLYKSSSGAPDDFDFSLGNEGKVSVLIRGDDLLGVSISGVAELQAQVEVTTPSLRQYRSDIIDIMMSEALIKS